MSTVPFPMHGRRALCARLVVLVSLVALAAGCRTNAMKGTPFFTGEYKGRVGPAEDRVNLWPLVYWRDPALSVLWPVGEYADDRIAVRPLFSRYRDEPDGPYTETNILWPIAHFDVRRKDYRVFPYFWGGTWGDGSYHVLFPFLWDFRHPKDGSGCNALFPLWIRDWDETKGWSETDVLWPIFNRETGPNKDYVRLFPLFGRSRDLRNDRGYGFDWALAGLVGRYKAAFAETYWALPLFLRDVRDDELWTPLWCGSLGGDKRWWTVPLLLSGGRYDTDGSDSLVALLGFLAGWQRTDDRFHYSWLLPLWYREDANLFTLPYAHWKSGDGTEHTWYTPLFGTLRGTHSGSWLFPLWDAETTRGAAFDPTTGERVSEGSLEEFSLLWFLYDSRREHASADAHDYARRRVLWRLYHDETLDGDRSIDIFPGIGIDSKKDGYRKFSFLWRLFRYEDDPDKGTSLDILFLPICRP